MKKTSGWSSPVLIDLWFRKFLSMEIRTELRNLKKYFVVCFVRKPSHTPTLRLKVNQFKCHFESRSLEEEKPVETRVVMGTDAVATLGDS